MTTARFSDLPRNRLLIGDAAVRLRELPGSSVDCVITSPPYFGQRDYGSEGQIGSEQHIDGWVRKLLDVCHELDRILKPGGSLWLNLGDGYSRHPREGAPKKGLLLGPQRVALALAAQGWILRNQIIWAKTNPLPSSVTDRLACTHEVIYFFTRAQRYYFDLDAIREPGSGVTRPRAHVGTQQYPPTEAAAKHGSLPRVDLNHGLAAMKRTGRATHPLGKNPGDLWQIATANYHGAHFATFPAELIRRPILATCPEKVCLACGEPWRRRGQRVNGRLLRTGALAPGCTCNRASGSGVVLDPFMGAGTVAIAAEQFGRDWLGIELNPAFAALAEQRLATWRATPARTRPRPP